MPPVILGAVAATAAASAAAFITGTAIGVAAGTAFFGSLILGGLSYALAPKPKRNQGLGNVNQINNSTVAVRQAAATRKSVYGHTRIADVYAQMVATGTNGKIHAILVLCQGPITSIDEIWVNDYVIPADWIAANGNVTQGRYAGYLRIRKHLGDANQAADSVAVAEVPDWTVNHRLQGVAYLFITMTKNQDVYPTGVPNFSAVVKGKPILDPRTGMSGFTANVALFAYDYIAQADYGFQADPDDVDQTNVAAEANICDEIVDVTALDMAVASVAPATDVITLAGGRLLFELGDRVEIVTAGTPPAGLAVSTDYYVIPYQMLTTPRLKLAASLDDAMAGAAIDITSAGSGALTVRKTGEPRYHGAGIVDTQSQLGDVLNNMLNAMAGRAVNAGGAWRLLAGAYHAPTVELVDVHDFRGAMGGRTAIAMSDRNNVISGLYVGSQNNYQEADYPTVRIQTFIDQDNGQEYPVSLNLPFTNRPTTAQRIAKIELYRARQEIVFNSPCSMKGFLLQAGDTCMLTSDRYGWAQKPFEVTQFTFTSQGGDNPALVTSLTFRETAQAIYDWSAGEGVDVDPAPNSNLPNPFEVLAPTGVRFSSRAIATAQGDTVFCLGLAWDPHPDAFVTEHGFFEIQFKLSSESDWRPSFFVAGALTSTDVLNSSVNVAYDLRIRAINNLGVRSSWVTIEGAIVGTSGGVDNTQDWGNWVDHPGSGNFQDWGNWTDAADSAHSQDWGYFT